MKKNKQLPIAKNEDVEFSREFADREDFQAQRRAQRADKRQEKRG
jgi:hypothetical protein